ncbi:hypothetical protein CEN47_12805 [Fischerella thermalis CCMEE 5319]|nr:hypothetical protein CEN47_12805 [Fischerella thermalis CCMEE 5319]
MDFGFCGKFVDPLRLSVRVRQLPALVSDPKAIARLKAFQDRFWIVKYLLNKRLRFPSVIIIFQTGITFARD